MTQPGDDSFEADIRRESGEQLALFVNLEGFEGPIDLLLSLARDQKVDLTQIAILPLAEQYLNFISSARQLDLEIAADYLVMAAWLAYLKSRLLLPDPEPEQDEEIIDMADALRYQLVRLEAMQQAAKRLISLPRLGQQRFARGAVEQFSITNEAVWQASLYDLLACYGDIQSGLENETLTIAATKLFFGRGGGETPAASDRQHAGLDGAGEFSSSQSACAHRPAVGHRVAFCRIA